MYGFDSHVFLFVDERRIFISNGSGITFHEKKAAYSDGYKAWATITLPVSSVLLPSGDPAFVAYALFGCHRLEGTAPVGNFDAGIQICGYLQICLGFRQFI